MLISCRLTLYPFLIFLSLYRGQSKICPAKQSFHFLRLLLTQNLRGQLLRFLWRSIAFTHSNFFVTISSRRQLHYRGGPSDDSQKLTILTQSASSSTFRIFGDAVNFRISRRDFSARSQSPSRWPWPTSNSILVSTSWKPRWSRQGRKTWQRWRPLPRLIFSTI